jgi:7-cyano-7-deazaguanine reductase
MGNRKKSVEKTNKKNKINKADKIKIAIGIKKLKSTNNIKDSKSTKNKFSNKTKESNKTKVSSKTKKSNVKTKATDVKTTKRNFKTIIPAAYKTPNEKLYGEKIIEENELERFPNRTLVRKYSIEFTCPEFTCVCPRSGFPDFATIFIRYVPDQWCIELKSLKLYINGFRNEKVFHEDVTNQILDDLVALLDPWEMEVIGEFSVRGNIKTVIRSEHIKS